MKILSKILLSALFIVGAFSVDAQIDSINGLIPRLNHIAVHVYDLEKSTAFYERVLNLKKIPEPFKDGLHTWFTLNEAGQLHLIQGAGKDIARNKNNHLCFSVNSVDAFIKILDHHEIPYSNWPGQSQTVTVRVDGIKQIYFQDPDGYWIEINDDHKPH